MTQSVDRLFELHDAAVAGGNFELARSIIDCIVGGEPLEKTLSGCVGRWRIEARAVLRRRAAGNSRQSGNHSDDARVLRAALTRYAASAEYARDKRPGGVPAVKNASLFSMLSASKGKVPSVRTLRRRLKNAA
jgi:hypothetical protein